MSVISIDTNEYEIDGILFDKDGTIIDFMLWIHWAEEFIELIGDQVDFSFDKDMLSQFLGYSHDSSWDPKGPLAISSEQDILTILSLGLYQQSIPWNQAYQIVNDAHQILEETFRFKQYIKPVNGLIHLLNQAKDHAIKMAVVTSDNYDKARKHLDALGIREYFSAIVGHDLVQRGKPYPEMVYLACEKMGVHPGKTIIFGDSNGDMTLGKNSGVLAGIGIIPSPTSQNEHLKNADHIISDYCNINLDESIS
ncbi:MAG TPA: HAD family phosphatase [Candidatus Avamphibacillus sp.]|nr:HAD family phosphatase [Candidatus Avamphibacillus sp.]